MPNSGAAGEYSALMVIRQYHISRGEGHRNVILIPASAHGTNPASSSMAGFKILVTATDPEGNIDVEDFRKKAIENRDNLIGAMITYPQLTVFSRNQSRNCARLFTRMADKYSWMVPT